MSLTSDSDPIELQMTGERYLPNISGEIQLEHLHRYAFARELVADRRVIDIACGEGYGSKYLGETAKSVLGVDVDQDAIAHAIKRYSSEKVRFSVGDASCIPAPDKSADVVVSFETIEHISDPSDLVREANRTLCDGGLFIVSTPNPIEYTIIPEYDNPFHINELRVGKFIQLLEESFDNVQLYGQRCRSVSLMFEIDPKNNNQLETYTDQTGGSNQLIGSKPLYFVAVASKGSLPRTVDSVLSLSPENTYRNNNNELELLPTLFKTTWSASKIDEHPYQARGNTSADIVSSIESTSVDELIERLTLSRQSSNTLRNQVVELEVTQSELYSEIETRGQALDSLRAETTSLKQTIAELTEEIETRGQTITAFETDSNLREKTIAELRAEIARVEREIAQRDLLLDQIRNSDSGRTIVNESDLQLLQDYEFLKRQYGELLTSTSWKITRPFRSFSAAVRNTLLGKTAQRGTNLIRRYMQAESIVKSTFDLQFYLDTNPDVASSGVDPFAHYVTYGINEGRPGRPMNSISPELSIPEPQFTAGRNQAQRGLRNLLYIVHEATITGAPILALATLKELSSSFNVYVILLSSGPLVREYEKLAVSVATLKERKGIWHVFINSHSQDIAPFPFEYEYIIANTVVAGRELPHIVNTVKTRAIVSLIHEYPTQDLVGYFDETAYESDLVVYSSEFVRDATVEMLESYGVRNSIVLPQGKIKYSDIYDDSPTCETSQSRYRSGTLDLSAPWTDKHYIVGCGTIDFRKGVDLFVAVASQIAQKIQVDKVQFVWLGAPVEQSRSYAIMVEQQIKNSGLESTIHLVDHLDNPDALFANASAMLITSRLDPLPNVAIDAIYYGTPVVCFDQAGGLPDYIRSLSLITDHEIGVAVPYGDVNAMAEATLEILDTRHGSTKIPPANYFDREKLSDFMSMKRYVTELQNVLKLAAQRRDKVNAIADEASRISGSSSREFIRAWASGSLRKGKPEVGFHSGIAAQQTGFELEPIEAYLTHISKTSIPENLTYVAISEYHERPKVTSVRFALHIHAYYTHLVEDIFQRINKNDTKPDLFISVPNESARNEVLRIAKQNKLAPIEVAIAPNLGRNFGPMINLAGRLAAEYPIIGHIHTKETAHVPERDFVSQWRDFLLENTIGGRYPTMDLIVDKMINDREIAISFPDDPLIIGWTKNRAFGEELLKRIDWEGDIPSYFNFPIGSMFWATSEAFTRIEKLGITDDEMPKEPLPTDGTILHALERVIGLLPELLGKKTLLVKMPGTSRNFSSD